MLQPDPELERLTHKRGFGYYQHPEWFVATLVIALLTMVVQVVRFIPPKFAQFKPPDPTHVLIRTIYTLVISGIVTADWIAKRRWLKRHPDIQDLPLPNTAYVLALLGLVLAMG